MSNAAHRAAAFMEALALDDSHGYDQQFRWGERGDYDCSSAVITAYEQAGVPVKRRGASYTGNMYQAFLACGFRDVTAAVDLASGENLLRGDVLLNHVRHTAICIGSGKTAEASVNELGRATGGEPGDQSGREFLIRPYRNYPWDCVLRYFGEDAAPAPDTAPERTAQLSLPYIYYAAKGESVRSMQLLLNGRGFDVGAAGADGDYGADTKKALTEFQRQFSLAPDGICGPDSWARLLKG